MRREQYRISQEKGKALADACKNYSWLKSYGSIINELISDGQTNINICNVETGHNTPLFYCCQNNYVDGVRRLFSRSDFDFEQERIFQSFCISCEKGHSEIVDLFLKQESLQGEFYAQSDGNGIHPLRIAVEAGHLQIVKLMLNDSKSQFFTRMRD